MNNRTMKTNSKKIIQIIFLNIIMFYVFYKLCIFIANKTSFFELNIAKDIIGINIVLGFISIFSFFLYSYLYTDDYFHMFSLMYISIYFEFMFCTFMGERFNLIKLIENNNLVLGLQYFFRTSIMWLAFYKNNFINKYLTRNKIYSIFLSMIITLICLITEIYIYNTGISNSDSIILEIVQAFINGITYILLIRFSILYSMKKNRNYLITFIAIDVMFLSRIIFVKDYYPNMEIMYKINRMVIALGFSLVIISMFWEIIYRTKENRKLVKKYNEQKSEMDKLKAEDELRTQFFSNISHELRTPLNILICSFQLLKSKSENKDELFYYYKKYEDTISTNSSRMLRLINNIIDASKFDAGCFKMQFTNCDIISLVEEVTISIAKCEKAQNRNIIFDTNTEYLVIRCDPYNIERVILNLLSNAVKFTEKDGNIEVICEEEKDYLIIKVKDDGIGIPPEYRKRIFDRFVQVDRSFRRNTEGSGIGLSLVKSIVDEHGGEVYLNDKVSSGCEFIVKLPNIVIDSEFNSLNYDTSTKKEINSRVSIELSDID